MNKKLQKGITTTMAAAMGLGVVAPTVSVMAAPTTGWTKTASGWNYLVDGAKQTGWVKDGSTWYFLNSNGTMVTGWQKDGSTWYFLNADGSMASNQWVKDGSTWYYLNASGSMASNQWVKDGQSWYYLKASGAMAVNETTPDGFRVDEKGAWIEEFAVKSVASLNATQVAITFTKAVDKTTLFDKNNNIIAKTVTVTNLDANNVTGGISGTLSEDGKVLVITAVNALAGRYNVTVDNLLGKDGKAIVKYDQIIDIAADKVAPSIVSTTKTTASTFKVAFSEPMRSLGTVTYKFADGTPTTDVTYALSADGTSATFQLGSSIAAGKQVIATLVGAQDKAFNLITPHPATLTFVMGAKDGVAPTVVSIVQTGAKTFAVKFSEEIMAAPVVKVDNVAVPVASIVKDDADATKYNVTVGYVLDGLKNVVVDTFADLSGEPGTQTPRIVSFTKDAVAPTAVSNVVADETDKCEYVEFTFDKDVELGVNAQITVTGKYVKDYVTTEINTGITVPVAQKTASNKKVVRVKLATLLNGKDVKGAAYSLNVSFDGITNGAGTAAKATTAAFTRGTDGVVANTDVVTVKGLVALNNNQLKVTFDREVDGASATSVANYVIDGAVVESVTLKPKATDANGVVTQEAVVNLKANSNGFTGVRNISVSNVKALGSTKVMTPYFTNTLVLNENIAPVVTSARLKTTNTIELTFSEKITSLNGDDFEVLIGGKSQATVEKINVSEANGTTTVTLTINAVDATKLSSGITLKALDSLDIVDSVGNKLSVPANITITQ